MADPPKSSGFLQSGDHAGEARAYPFRHFIPSPDHPRIQGVSTMNALEWCDSRRKIPEPAWLINRLDKKNTPPFKGFTADGKPNPELFVYDQDEGAPVKEMVNAAERLLQALNATESTNVQFGDLRSDEFRIWSNPELYVNPGGLRLDECNANVQKLVHRLLQASSSPEGYDKILGCCLTNHFLGELVNGAKVLNMHSYNFRLFNKPSLTEPWGFTFFGHHLALSVVVVGKRIVHGPNFFGAEPDHIDEGEHKGLRLFVDEEKEGLALMQSLAEEMKRKAQVEEILTNVDWWNPFDERHVGGAQQDNRIVPYQGVSVSLFNESQKSAVMRIFSAFHSTLPPKALTAQLKRIEAHLDETYFMWIGKYGEDDAFYYRLHSPVGFVEFDFHCGIFLTNTTPSKCHVHTVVRLPNGADYGRALLAQYERENVNSCTRKEP